MTVRQSAEHTVKPRVILAASRLQTFTVQEIVDEGKVTPKQAYDQLKKLEKEGLIGASRLPANQPFRPKNLYEVPAEKRLELSKMAAKYGHRASESVPQGLKIARDETLARATTRGGNLLSSIENRLSSIVPSALKREGIDGVMTVFGEIAKDLGEVEIDLETGQAASKDFPEDHRAATLAFRLREIRGTLRDMEKAVRKQRNVLWLGDLVNRWVPNIQNHRQWAREALRPKESKLDIEFVLDLLSPGLHRHELIPAVITSQALRTNNLDLIRACLRTLDQSESLWWRYNEVSTDFLNGDYDEVYKKWNDVYSRLKKDLTAVDKDVAIGVYLFDPKNLRESKLPPLLEKYNVSIVSPHSLAVWNLSEEIVRPLLVDPYSVASSNCGPLINTVALCPEEKSSAVWELYAYGPLTSIIRRWPGAPPLRVAVGVDGLTGADVDVPKIAEALRHEQGIVVLERPDTHDLKSFRKDAEKVLGDVEMVAAVNTNSEAYAAF